MVVAKLYPPGYFSIRTVIRCTFTCVSRIWRERCVHTRVQGVRTSEFVTDGRWRPDVSTKGHAYDGNRISRDIRAASNMVARGRRRPLFPRDEHAENTHDSLSSTSVSSSFRNPLVVCASLLLLLLLLLSMLLYRRDCWCCEREKYYRIFLSLPPHVTTQIVRSHVRVSADYLLSNEFHVPAGFVQQIWSAFFPWTFISPDGGCWGGVERRVIVARLRRFQPTRFAGIPTEPLSVRYGPLGSYHRPACTWYFNRADDNLRNFHWTNRVFHTKTILTVWKYCLNRTTPRRRYPFAAWRAIPFHTIFGLYSDFIRAWRQSTGARSMGTLPCPV